MRSSYVEGCLLFRIVSHTVTILTERYHTLLRLQVAIAKRNLFEHYKVSTPSKKSHARRGVRV